MNLTEFLSSVNSSEPPPGLSQLLLSLWYDTKGNWKKSHDLISEIDSNEAALIHAYLHRKEGDIWNADYWYRRAGTKRPDNTLQEEWESLILKMI